MSYTINSYRFLICLLLFSLPYISFSKDKSKPFVIVLDAGHGGHDSGNSHHGFVEKDIALKITKKVGEALKKDPRFEVVYTRDKDVYLTLRERTVVANKAKADFFVSIHCNAVGGGNQAHGVETFVLGNTKNKENLEVAKKENSVIYLEENYEEHYANFDPNSPSSLIGLTIAQEEYLDQSIQLAGLVQYNIITNLKRRDRSVKQAPFYVLAYTFMPSILIEVGFLTNKNEGFYLNSAKGQNEMAKQIIDAIVSYRNSLPDVHFEAPIAESSPQQVAEITNTDVLYYVQIGASSNKLETKPYNFKGLQNVHRRQEGKLFKYFYGQTTSYEQALELQKVAKNAGYTESFVVAFKEGKQVRLADVVKSK